MILPACDVLGDGANDVSMIQVADVGVGISGQEGMQVRTGGCPGQPKGSHCELRWPRCELSCRAEGLDLDIAGARLLLNRQ